MEATGRYEFNLAQTTYSNNIRCVELNRIHIMGEALEVSCRHIICYLDAEIIRMEKRLEKHMMDQAKWTENQVTALVGVTPISQDSSRLRGKRCIHGGRASICTVLYMTTLSATQCNPVIKSFYKKLIAQGKYKKVVITARMRKFITMLNVMVRDRCVWAY